MAIPITAAQLKMIFPAAQLDYLQQVAKEFNANPTAFGLDTAQRRAHFFAQVREEAGEALQGVTEGLNYTPEGLAANFLYYRQHPDEARKDARHTDPATNKLVPAAQQTIANKAYGNKYGNGDIASGDGWRYRGRGYLQVTFKDNYAAVSRQCKPVFPGMDVDFVANPEAVAAFPGSVRAAIGYWLWKDLPALADKGTAPANVDSITAVINKNTPSYPARRDHFTLAWRAFQ